MEQLRKYLIDGIAGIILLALLVAVLLPWPLSEPVIAKDLPSPLARNILKTTAVTVKRNDPFTIAAVFGYHQAPAVITPAPPRQDTSYLITFLGYIAGEKGNKKYYFKDSRSNVVLMLAPGEDNGKGWKLVSVTEKSYVIQNKGTTYTIPR
jgi:hypothetical protein